jgi:sulfur-carrier protein
MLKFVRKVTTEIAKTEPPTKLRFMPRVFIPSQLRALTGGQPELEVTGVTVRELIANLDQRFPGITERLLVAGELSPALQVSIDGVFSRRGADARVDTRSEVHFLPVFGGG